MEKLTKDEAAFLKAMRLLTDETRHKFMIQVSRYLLMIRNDASFRKRCRKQKELGLNPFLLWMEKNGFRPAFKCEY
jgi:hypothetical protein